MYLLQRRHAPGVSVGGPPCPAARQTPLRVADVCGVPESSRWRRHVEVVVTLLAGTITVRPCATGDYVCGVLGLRAHVAFRNYSDDIRSGDWTIDNLTAVVPPVASSQ